MPAEERSAADGSARIWVYMPGQTPWSFELPPGSIVVGRGDHCGLRLDHGTVSWDHVEFARIGHAIVATDLGSRNGTLLNGRPLAAPAPVRCGDILTLGGVRLEVAVPAVSSHARTVGPAMPPIALTEEQRELARALAAPFRAPGAVAARPPTRAELARHLHLSERTVQRRTDALAKSVGLRGHEGRDRPLLLARRIIEYGLDGQREEG
jgi:AraC-like DNA-binding protein